MGAAEKRRGGFNWRRHGSRLLAGNYVVRILERPLRQAVTSYPGTNQVVSLFFGTNRRGVFQLDELRQQQKSAC